MQNIYKEKNIVNSIHPKIIHNSVTEVDEWGKRKLAYLIDDLAEGYYVLMSFTADPAFPAELDRLMRINTGIMRSIIVSKEA